MIRSLDTVFVKNLKEKMVNDPSSPGVPPIATLCIDVQEPSQISERLKGVYKYEFLGGQHISHARIELYRENLFFVWVYPS